MILIDVTWLFESHVTPEKLQCAEGEDDGGATQSSKPEWEGLSKDDLSSNKVLRSELFARREIAGKKAKMIM